MMALLGSLLGFLGALFPECFRIYRDSADRKHELAILDRQLDAQKAGINARQEAISQWTQTLADAAETRTIYQTWQSGTPWVDALNGTVRPVLAYAFFLLYAYVKVTQGLHTPWLLWEEDDKAIFAGIVSFYFGQRAMQKYRGGAK